MTTGRGAGQEHHRPQASACERSQRGGWAGSTRHESAPLRPDCLPCLSRGPRSVLCVRARLRDSPIWEGADHRPDLGLGDAGRHPRGEDLPVLPAQSPRRDQAQFHVFPAQLAGAARLGQIRGHMRDGGCVRVDLRIGAERQVVVQCEGALRVRSISVGDERCRQVRRGGASAPFARGSSSSRSRVLTEGCRSLP